VTAERRKTEGPQIRPTSREDQVVLGDNGGIVGGPIQYRLKKKETHRKVPFSL